MYFSFSLHFHLNQVFRKQLVLMFTGLLDGAPSAVDLLILATHHGQVVETGIMVFEIFQTLSQVEMLLQVFPLQFIKLIVVMAASAFTLMEYFYNVNLL